MSRKYGKKASEKIGRTMREFKRGKLKSGGSDKKVTSRAQAIAIGISQARREGYKVSPPPRSHATMSPDQKVRAYLERMRYDQEIDVLGMSRALRIDTWDAASALSRAVKTGFAVTDDGQWFGPAGARAHHAKILDARTVLVERVTLPTGRSASIHIRHGKGGYSGKLVFPNGNELPMFVGKPFTETDALRNAKEFLARGYGGHRARSGR